MSQQPSAIDTSDGGAIVHFARAERKGSHVLIGLYGFSGCGKTLSMLYLARGLVGPKGRIAMIDTENGRGLIYAMEAGGFDHCDLTPPFTPERYTSAIEAAEAGGYDALILDSASHLWDGMGGIVETAEASNLKGLVKWANPKARYKRWVQSLLNSRMHILIGMRAKEKVIQVTSANASKFPGIKIGEIVSVGMTAIQEKKFIYEMTAQLYLPLPDNGGKRGVPMIEKCPKDLLPAFPPGEQISIATGERIAQWVAGGVPVDHTALELQRTAEEHAGGGTEAMREWWSDLTPAEQKQLKPLLANLRSIAAEADAEAARRKADEDALKAEPRVDFGNPAVLPAGAAPSSNGVRQEPVIETYAQSDVMGETIAEFSSPAEYLYALEDYMSRCTADQCQAVYKANRANLERIAAMSAGYAAEIDRIKTKPRSVEL